MNLLDAALCLDCEEIYIRRDYNVGCPVCGSKYSFPVARYLKSIQGVRNEVVCNKKEGVEGDSPYSG